MQDTEELLKTARETVEQIKSDPRMAVVAYQKRLQIESMEKEVMDLSTEIEEARKAWKDRVEKVTEIATIHANQVSWCPEFDSAMRTVGLKVERERDMQVTAHLRALTRLTVPVKVDEAVREALGDDVEGAEFTGSGGEPVTTTVTVARKWPFTTTVRGRVGLCACTYISRYIDRYNIGSFGLPDEARKFFDAHQHDSSFDIVDVTCDHDSHTTND